MAISPAKSKIPQIKAYLVDTALPAAVPAEVSIFWGVGQGYTEDDCVLVTDGQAESEFKCYGTNRTVEERGSVLLVIKSFRPTPDGQREATERAFEIHDAIRDFLRTSPNESLGGLVTMASITDTVLLEDDESVGKDELAAGRLAVLTVTLTFQGRS